MDTFIAAVMCWAPNFAPRNWSYCNGALLAISSNNALFSLLGTTYGGDGRTTFGLPDLRGRIPLGYCGATGPGLSSYNLGQKGGVQTVTLNTTQIPSHNHAASLSSSTVSIPATTATATTDTPSAGVHFAKGSTDVNFVPNPTKMYASGVTNTTVGAPIAIGGSVTIGYTGANQPHENRQPFQVLNWIIALFGTYPSRN